MSLVMSSCCWLQTAPELTNTYTAPEMFWPDTAWLGAATSAVPPARATEKPK
jgi:hypothetical protein